MTTQTIIQKAKDGGNIVKLIKSYVFHREVEYKETKVDALQNLSVLLISKILKDEIEMEKLIEHIELNNKELDKLINHE